MKKLSAFFLIISFLLVLNGFSIAQEKPVLAAEMQKLLPHGAAVLLEINLGKIVAFHGEEILNRPASPGSILKLFTTYALLDCGEKSSDVFYCSPSSVDVKSSESCWYKPGHGNLNLKQALANSCNSWFRQWLADKNLEPAFKFWERLGVRRGRAETQRDNLMNLTGMKGGLKVKPLQLLVTAAALFNGGTLYRHTGWEKRHYLLTDSKIRVNPEVVKFIEDAMLEAYHLGNAQGVFPGDWLTDLYVKTGTSQAMKELEDGRISSDPLKVDGWCLVMFPRGESKYLMLVFRPGVTGFEAAGVAGRLVKIYMEGQ